MKLYLHPKASIVDAAIAAYAVGLHVISRAGTILLAPGSDAVQYRIALEAKVLEAFASSVKTAHTWPLNIEDAKP